MIWWKWLDNLDAKIPKISKLLDDMLVKLIGAIDWNMRHLTLIWLVILLIIVFCGWAFIYPVWRRKKIQRKHRKLLKEEAEKRVSQK